jgi:hypothetical protein
VVIFFAGLAQFEADMIGERTAEALQWRRQQGLACNRAGFGTRKVGKRSEWDMQQLGYIAEIAERLGKGEDVVLVVADFWGRGIKDHRGLLWGQVQHKDGKGTGNGFEWYWRATRWFHRMKHAGKLPPPYCDTAHTIPEPPRFTVEKRRKRPNAKPVIDEKAGWTAEQWREWFTLECARN